MKPIFVQVRNGEKDVRWLPLIGFAILLTVAGAAVGWLVVYPFTGAPGAAAPCVGAVFGLLLAMRQITATIAYHPLVIHQDEDVEHDIPA